MFYNFSSLYVIYSPSVFFFNLYVAIILMIILQNFSDAWLAGICKSRVENLPVGSEPWWVLPFVDVSSIIRV